MSDAIRLVTPICVIRYPWIFEPNRKFKPEGEYSVTCLVEETPAWQKLEQYIMKLYEQDYTARCTLARGRQLKKCEHLPFKKQIDKKGNVEKVFVVKNNAVGKTKEGKVFACEPRVIGPDPDVVLTEKDLQGKIGSGTKARVGFAVNLWQNDAQGVGVSARLTQVQIIEPVFYNPSDGYSDPDGGEGFSKVPADWFNPKPPGKFDPQAAAKDFVESLEKDYSKSMNKEEILKDLNSK